MIIKEQTLIKLTCISLKSKALEEPKDILRSSEIIHWDSTKIKSLSTKTLAERAMTCYYWNSNSYLTLRPLPLQSSKKFLFLIKLISEIENKEGEGHSRKQ